MCEILMFLKAKQRLIYINWSVVGQASAFLIDLVNNFHILTSSLNGEPCSERMLEKLKIEISFKKKFTVKY